MAWRNSTPCTDIVVMLANSPVSFPCENQTSIALNQKLCNRVFKNLWNYEQKCWIVAADGLMTDKLIQYPWPSCTGGCDVQPSGAAQPGSVEQSDAGGSVAQFQDETSWNCRGRHDRSIYHSYDMAGGSFLDRDMLDLRPEVEQEYLKILGLEKSPVLQLRTNAIMGLHLRSADLNQVSLHSPGSHARVDNSCRYGVIWLFGVPSSCLSVTGFMLPGCVFIFHPRVSY